MLVWLGQKERKEGMNEILFTSAEAANFLRVHINTIRRWSNSGLLFCYRIGPRKDRRFQKEELIKFLDSKLEKVLLSQNSIV